MNRFNRLVELRRIREEVNALAFARMLNRLEGVRREVVALDQQTWSEQESMRLGLGQEIDRSLSPPLMPSQMDDFLRGQAWRRQRLQQRMESLQEELEKAKAAWLAARAQLQQAEKLAEKEQKHQQYCLEQQEKKALDMIGILRNKTMFSQEGDLG
ncbi:MAG: flagellar export protein FliJ [Magnetococcales bacterium]|nr:flagellar export protein FliJ [Magnetococcales bacterium]